MSENIHLLPVWSTITLAWDKTKGAKKTIWAAMAVMSIFLFLLIIGFITFQIFVLDRPYEAGKPFNQTLGTILQLISYLFEIGILLIGIKRAYDFPINYRLMFTSFHFHTAIKLLGLYISQIIIIALILLPFIIITVLLNAITTDISKDFFLGLLLIATILTMIYVLVRMYLAPGMVIDKNLNPWKAIKTSFISTRYNFWRLLTVLIIKTLILAVSIIPLGIGLIWSIPFVVVCYGVIYKTLLPDVFTTA